MSVGSVPQESTPSVDGSSTARRTGATAVGTFALAYLAIAVGALIRVPLTIRVVGLSAYGVIVLSTAIVALFVIPIAAVRSTSRTLIAEHSSAPTDERALLRIVRTPTSVIAVTMCVIGLAVAAFTPVGALLDDAEGPSALEVRCLLAVAVVFSSIALFGAVGWGELEAHDQPAVFNVHLLVITLLGLGLTLLAFAVGAPFLVFGVIAVATSTLPYATVGVASARRRSSSSVTTPDGAYSMVGATVDGPNGDRRALRLFVRRSLLTFGVRSTNDGMTRGFDPALVAVLVSAAAAGEYSVVQRLSQASLVVPAALYPLVASGAARRRGRRMDSAGRGLARDVWAYALLGGLAGIGLVAVGRPLGELLIGSDSAVSLRMLGLFGVLGVVWSAELALAAHLSGPLSVQPMLKITGLCAVLNIGLSVALTIAVGWAGPVVASIISLTVSMASMASLVRRRPSVVTATFS